MGQRGQRCRGPVVETPGPPCAWKGARDTDRGPTLRGRAVAGAARPASHSAAPVGVSAVGTAVQDVTGDVVAITVVAPTFRFAQQAEDLVARLLHTRYELQVFLGLSAAS